MGVFILYSMAVNWNRDRGSWWSGRELWDSFVKAIGALLTPVVILGGIYSGQFTPTESAAIAVLTAILVEALIHKQGLLFLIFGRFSNLGTVSADMGRLIWRTVGETSTMMGSLFPILAIALSLNVFLTYQQVPNNIVEWLSGYIDSKVMFILLVNLFLLLVGCFLDAGSAILILSPLLPPMAQSFGIDLVHFGIMMTVNLEIGYLTPPMGLNLIVAMGAFKEDFATIIRGVWPFLVLMIIVLWVVAFYPPLSLFLIR
jgi:C4-dicarboxylate transporter, DctM subunit